MHRIISITADGRPVWYIGPFATEEAALAYMDAWSDFIDDLVSDLAKEHGAEIDVTVPWMNPPQPFGSKED